MILKFCSVWFDYAFQFNFSVSLQSRLNFKSIEHWEFPRISRRRWRIILFSSFDLPNRRWQFQIVSSAAPPLSLTAVSTENFFLFEKSFSKKLKFRGWSRAASCPSRRWIGSSWPEAKKKIFIHQEVYVMGNDKLYFHTFKMVKQQNGVNSWRWSFVDFWSIWYIRQIVNLQLWFYYFSFLFTWMYFRLSFGLTTSSCSKITGKEKWFNRIVILQLNC